MSSSGNQNSVTRKRGGRYMFHFRGRAGRGNRYNQRAQQNNVTVPENDNDGTTNQQKIPSYFSLTSGPYPGWKLYHTEEGFMEGSTTVHKVKTVEYFIQNNKHLFSTSNIEEALSFTIDLKLLYNDNNFQASWKNFREDLATHPEHTVACIGLGMHQVVLTDLSQAQNEAPEDRIDPESLSLPKINARIINFEPIIQLKNLKSNYYGKLVTVKGTIVRIGNMKLLCTWMTFECNACHGFQCVKQPEGFYTTPPTCTSPNCKSRTFTALHSSPYTQTVNWQSVRLQEIVADDQREGGRIPRTVECELTSDLVDTCSPGDIVTITGIVKVKNGEEYTKKQAASIFLLYIEVVSLVNMKTHSSVRKSAVEFNIKDYYAIKEIHSEKHLFRLIVNSLCPSIYGHEIVKAGLILCMFGGCQHHQDGRADPHILIVGDPGLGKSQMLQACSNVAPRGVYVCGNTSTSAGLTVTVVREGGGDYALEAGALILSDLGCCCIDEFDKMTTQHSALLEAMEQQTVSMAKAGVVCSLPARTSILAAANPVGGHYNKAKTVSENLRLGPALLSRFDLVFILLDQPNEQLDSMLSEHVMALHSGVKSTASLNSSFSSSVFSNRKDDVALGEKLKVLPGEELDYIPHQLLRKYIAYARKYVKPKLNSEAAEVLQQFYLQLRQQHQDIDCTPVTTRQLESLIRLTEARAKLELREEAVRSDAEDVVEMMKYSLIDTFSDDLGILNFTRSQHGSGMSSRSNAKKFVSCLQKRAETQSRSIFSVQELKEVASSGGINTSNFSNLLSTLNVQGFLLKKGNNLYQLLSADY